MRWSLFLCVLCLPAPAILAAGRRALSSEVIEATAAALVERHGEQHAPAIRRGVRQVAERWWAEDGDAEAFRAFCLQHFLPEPEQRRVAFERLELALEQAAGHLHEIRRTLTEPLELDRGPILPVDRLLARIDLGGHLDESLFETQVAFLALLNFPVHTLGDRLREGPQWSREAWARSRLMDRFALRVPAEVRQRITQALTAAGEYVDTYNIRLDRVLAADGRRLFPEGLRLISHWGLRDELAARYADPEGLERQRTIQRIMQRIVRQEIPAVVVDNPEVLWCPETNEVRPREPGAPAPSAAREPDTRYARILEVFRAVREEDPYAPSAPTYIARRFELERELSEEEVERLLVEILASEEVRLAAREIERRLGRPLEPFDIWYPGFTARGNLAEEVLDRAVRERYPDIESFERDLPGILERLGFASERARWLAERIVVDPARGAGHALGAVRREDRAHLRTRVGPQGMDYKGFHIAIHELGHNVEQVFSLHGMDYWSLAGVPNSAFTEALAFLFQERDLELLGFAAPDEGQRALAALWAAYEIGGVALVDMRLWRWLYAHPEASPAQLREATLALAREVWNEYFAPAFGVRDQELLAVYSHMIAYALYLPDYPLGHVIAFQLGEAIRGERFGAEFERVCRQGRLTPQAWMQGAVGEELSAKALLRAARRAL